MQMGQHKLKIQKFGPVDMANIDVKDIMLFIGPQASGKSTIGKTFYFFKSLRDHLLRYLLNALEEQSFIFSVAPFVQQIKEDFLGIYGPVRHFPDMLLHYDYGNGITAKVTLENGEFTSVWFGGDFNKRFQNLMGEVKNFSESTVEKQVALFSSRERIAIETRRAAFIERVGEQINDLFNDDREIIYLPAGRSLVTTMSEQLSNIELGANLDDLMQMFIKQINNMRPTFSKGLTELIIDKRAREGRNFDSTKLIQAEKIIAEIIHGHYEYSPMGGERLYFDETGGYTKINYASSGQQESIWILFLIFLLILSDRKVFLVIEEPEAHLYPEAQKKIIDLLALFANASENQLIITTHSPYILSALNNLLYAYRLGQQKADDVSQVVPQFTWINPGRLEGYMVSNGKIRSILDKESGLLETAAIDSASEIIIDIFNKLFDLDDK